MGEPQEEVKAVTVEEVLNRFTKKEAIEEYEGAKFKIRKVKAGSILFSRGIVALPFMKDVLEKWNEMSVEERQNKAKEVMDSKEGDAAVADALIVSGVIDPPFSDEDPCPAGAVPVSQIDEELKVFLVNKILKLSSLDKKAAEFFRPSAPGVSEGAGPGSAPLQPEAE